MRNYDKMFAVCDGCIEPVDMVFNADTGVYECPNCGVAYDSNKLSNGGKDKFNNVIEIGVEGE